MHKKSASPDVENNKPPGVSPRKWKEVITNHEKRNVVYEIREEIMSEVLRQCQKIYMEKKAVDILVDCAAEAWIRLISMYSLDKDNEHVPAYSADKTCEPCPSDSWARKTIPIKLKKFKGKSFQEADTKDNSQTIPKLNLSHLKSDDIFSIVSTASDFTASTSKFHYNTQKTPDTVTNETSEEEYVEDHPILEEEIVEDETSESTVSEFTKICTKRLSFKLPQGSKSEKLKYISPKFASKNVAPTDPRPLRTHVQSFYPIKRYKKKPNAEPFIDAAVCMHKLKYLSQDEGSNTDIVNNE